MKNLKHIILSMLILVQVSFAQSERKQETRDLIDKVIQVYGGETLKKLNFLSFDREMRLGWPGQSYSSSRVDFAPDKYHLKLNLRDKKSSVERWVYQNGNIYHNRIVTGDKDSFVIDYLNNEYSVDKNQTFERQIGLQTLYSDLLLAYTMVNRFDDFTQGGKSYFQGKNRDVLLFKYRENAEAMKIHIDSEKGYIIHTERTTNSGNFIEINYEKHKKHDGLLYSSVYRDFRNDQLAIYSLSDLISTSEIPDKLYTIDNGFEKQSEQIDSSVLKADQIKKGIYHVGSNGSFSTFFKDKGNFIGVNAYEGLNDKLAEVRKIENLPLKYMIVTHHHSDHLEGVNDAIESGASLIVTAMTYETLKGSDEYSLKGAEVIVVDDILEIGPVKIFMIPSNHVAQNLIVYHKNGKVIYQDDHYNATTKNKHSHINQSGLYLNQKLSALNLDIELLLGGHGSKAEKWEDFQKAINLNHINNFCPSQRKICINELP